MVGSDRLSKSKSSFIRVLSSNLKVVGDILDASDSFSMRPVSSRLMSVILASSVLISSKLKSSSVADDAFCVSSAISSLSKDKVRRSLFISIVSSMSASFATAALLLASWVSTSLLASVSVATSKSAKSKTKSSSNVSSFERLLTLS